LEIINIFKAMKNIYILLLAVFVPILIFCSCDKVDCNDGLDGQWQMYEWKSPDGKLIGDKEMQIYYSFQLQMMMFQKLSVSKRYQLSSFQNMGSSIRVYEPVKYKGNGHDEILSMDVLKQYGVPSDGMMKVESLTSKTLVLSSPETGMLSFRKY
jgi:hypothetical protein